jgi:FkbM family methyltransferase
VQGAELMALSGAEKTLARTAAVHCEVEFSPIYRDQPLFPEICEYLFSHNFILIDLLIPGRYHYLTPSGRVAQDRLLWADAVFFRVTGDPEAQRVQALIAASVYRKPTLAEHLLILSERRGLRDVGEEDRVRWEIPVPRAAGERGSHPLPSRPRESDHALIRGNLDATRDRTETRGCLSEMDLPNAGSATPDKAGIAFDKAALAASPRVKPDGGYLPPMVSYAQNFEDVMLRRALQDIECGFYVDIGAADPDTDSVTRWFYENGWRGINVEPDPKYFTRLGARRPEDKNLQCVIGATSANVVFSIADRGGWSTGSTERMAEITNLRGVATRPILVPAITLDQLLILSCGRVIDFLKIDAEDMEDEILGSASFVSQRPRIIVAEATLLDSQLPSHQVWEPKLLSKGYKFAWFDGLNRFYVRSEDEWRLELFKVPPCIFDNFFNVTIGTRAAEVREQAAHTEAELNRALAKSEAKLSEANANAVSANARADAIEGELQRITAEFEQRKADFETQIEKLVEQESEYQRLREGLAQRDGDYRRLQARLVQMESSRRGLLESLAQRESDYQQLEESLTQRESEYQQLEESLAQRESEYQENLAQRESEIAVLAAERDKAAAQSLRWFAAAIPNDQDRLDCRKQYPIQTRFYRNRLVSWLAVGPKRRRQILTAAAMRARDRQDWGLAARYYREALDLAPNRPALWVQYGHALKETGNLVAAESAYRKSLALDDGIADTHLQLGHVLKLQGRNAEAANAYTRSLTLAPGSPHAMHELLALGSAETKTPGTERTVDPSRELADCASAESIEGQEHIMVENEENEEVQQELNHTERPLMGLEQYDSVDGPRFFDPRAKEIYQMLAPKIIEKSN